MNNHRVENIFFKTQGAFSFSRYSQSGWRECIRLLIRKGFTDEMVEAVLYSKWMRWAADMDDSRHFGYYNSTTLRNYLNTLSDVGQKIREELMN